MRSRYQSLRAVGSVGWTILWPASGKVMPALSWPRRSFTTAKPPSRKPRKSLENPVFRYVWRSPDCGPGGFMDDAPPRGALTKERRPDITRALAMTQQYELELL